MKTNIFKKADKSTDDSLAICTQAELGALLSACPEASVVVAKIIDEINLIKIESRQAKELVTELNEKLEALKAEFNKKNDSLTAYCQASFESMKSSNVSIRNAIEELQKKI